MDTLEIILTAAGTAATVIGILYTMIRRLMEKASEQAVDKKRLEEVEIEVGKKPCETHTREIEAHDSDISALKCMLKSDTDMLIELSKWAMKADAGMIDRLARKGSPLKMTQAGMELYKASHADEALSKMRGFLLDEMAKSSPRTEYDIEETALDVLLRNVGREELDAVKRYIYYSPSEFATSRGEAVRFDLYSILKLMSIKLRDDYISLSRQEMD